MGPTLIFDKSAIHSFGIKESGWLNHLYTLNIVPVLYMEIMADLKKIPRDLELSMEQVRRLAAKFSPINQYHNMHHRELWEGELLYGGGVEMGGRAIISGGVQLEADNGRRGVFFDSRPEDEALLRWSEGQFQELEHLLALRWRESTRNVDLEAFVRSFRKVRPKGPKIEDLESLAKAAAAAREGTAGQYKLLCDVISTLEIDQSIARKAIARWKSVGKPKIKQYCPYSLFCYAVTLFTFVGIGENLITTRPTNLIDLQYLYYIPFCDVFVSNDNLHKNTVPLFMNTNQIFMEGGRLKKDLELVQASWDQCDESVHSKGTMSFARFPPRDLELATARVWDKFVPDWRWHADQPEPTRTPEDDARTMERLKPMMDAIEKYQRENT
jgi:hypothetical protein